VHRLYDKRLVSIRQGFILNQWNLIMKNNSIWQGWCQFTLNTKQLTVVLLCATISLLMPLAGTAKTSPPIIDTVGSDVLQDLQDKLLAPADCLPHCANYPHMIVYVEKQQLRLNLTLHSQIDTAVPLPGHPKHWLPQQVKLNGKPATALRLQNQQLWLQVPAGIHQLELIGAWRDEDQIQLPLPLKPYYVQLNIAKDSDFHDVQGIHKNGVVDAQLQFNRTDKSQQPHLRAGKLASLVQIERELNLGLNWTMHTTVSRLTPLGSAVVLKLPLLTGESITSSLPRVKQQYAEVNLSANQQRLSWTSTLEKAPELNLVANAQGDWYEIWRLRANAIWHIDTAGLPRIQQSSEQNDSLSTWWPRPSEQLNLRISRPQGIQGQTTTIDSSDLDISLGQHAVNLDLTLHLRKSQGGQHRITLPEHTEVESVLINGQSRAIQRQQQDLLISLAPGKQVLNITLRQAQAPGWFYQSPAINLGAQGANAQTHIKLPKDRWLLLAGGPLMGPAVLFWGVFIVLLGLAWGLSRLKNIPLPFHHWLLLGILMSQISLWGLALMVIWLLLMSWRQQHHFESWARWRFNLLQIGLAFLSGIALLALLMALESGLLDGPSMYVQGNGSSSHDLIWYQDRFDMQQQVVWLFSLPLIAYRALMLAVALWLAFALLVWLRWIWQCYSHDGLWRKK